MPDYGKGKIYAIRCTDSDDVYIGSTVESLSKRMSGHRRKHNSTPNACASSALIGRGTAYIELVEDFPCERVEQLRKREGEIIRSRVCVNRYIAGRTGEEYREENKEHRDKQKKEYYQANREEIVQKKKEYHEQHKEKHNAYTREYRKKNKEILAKKAKEKRQKQDKEKVNAKARENYHKRMEQKKALTPVADAAAV
jgi:hypothetical protein